MIKVISKTKAELVININKRKILIPIEKYKIGDKAQDTVLASDLQGKVKPSSLNHNTWANRHIKKLGFMENEDFVKVFLKLNKKSDFKFEIALSKELKNSSPQKLSALGYSRDIIFSFNSAREIMIIENREIRREVLNAYDQLQEITKNGFYISPESLKNPSKKLIRFSSSIMETRKATILKRDKLYSRIEKFLDSETGYKENSLNRVVSTVYQHLHIATSLKTAVLVIQDNLLNSEKDGLKINSYNPKQKKPYDKDYIVAMNYYNEKQLKLFDSYFLGILEDVIKHLDSPHTLPTSKSVIKILKDSGIRQIKLVTELDLGTTFQGKVRTEIDELVDEYKKEKMEYPEMVKKLEKLRTGKIFKI